jgi:uncharacterized protein (TIGR00645 family)
VIGGSPENSRGGHARERFIERLLVAARWLMAPLYLGLALLLFLFIVQFFTELVHIVAALIAREDPRLTLSTLRLLDLVLVAGLVVMVMISGFENYIAKIELGDKREGLEWLTRLDSGSIKVKIMGAIAVISAIYLLELFFDIDQVASDKLLWLVVLHLTFVVTAVLLALLDRLSEH